MNTENQKTTEPTLTPDQQEMVQLVNRIKEITEKQSPGIDFLFTGCIGNDTAFSIGGGSLMQLSKVLCDTLQKNPMLLGAVSAAVDVANMRLSEAQHIKPVAEA